MHSPSLANAFVVIFLAINVTAQTFTRVQRRPMATNLPGYTRQPDNKVMKSLDNLPVCFSQCMIDKATRLQSYDLYTQTFEDLCGAQWMAFGRWYKSDLANCFQLRCDAEAKKAGVDRKVLNRKAADWLKSKCPNRVAAIGTAGVD